MAYQMIEEYSCIWRDGVTPLTPEGFAIHWWGDGAPQFFPIVNLLVNRAAAASASVHFVGEAGRVACLTPINEVAWAQGDGANGWGNRHLVSIECNPRCTAEDRETIAELIADQHIENGIPIILHPHKNFVSTQCPGVWEQWIPWLTERAMQIVKEKTLANSGSVTETPKEWDEMASKEDIKEAIREVLREEFDIIDPTADTTNVTQKSSLIKKARWEAYLWAKNEKILVKILEAVTGVKKAE